MSCNVVDSAQLCVYRGDDSAFILRVTERGSGAPVDLDGAVLSMHVKPQFSAVSLPLPDGCLKVAGPGKVTVLVPRSFTAAAPWREGSYDLRMIQHGSVRTLLRGRISVTGNVTPMDAGGSGTPADPWQIGVVVAPGAVVSGAGTEPAPQQMYRAALQQGFSGSLNDYLSSPAHAGVYSSNQW